MENAEEEKRLILFSVHNSEQYILNIKRSNAWTQYKQFNELTINHVLQSNEEEHHNSCCEIMTIIFGQLNHVLRTCICGHSLTLGLISLQPPF